MLKIDIIIYSIKKCLTLKIPHSPSLDCKEKHELIEKKKMFLIQKPHLFIGD